MIIPQKVTTFFWFDSNAEEAVEHYVSLFKNSRITSMLRYGKGDRGPEGTVMSIGFELEGQKFGAINGGPVFKLNEAMSLYVGCETQQELDRLWDALSDGGTIQHCGWLKDRFGLSWQINYARYLDMVEGEEPAKSRRVIDALLGMKKVDIAALERAHAGT